MAMHRYTRWASGLHGALCGDSSLSLTHSAERVTCPLCAARQWPTVYRDGSPCLPGMTASMACTHWPLECCGSSECTAESNCCTVQSK